MYSIGLEVIVYGFNGVMNFNGKQITRNVSSSYPLFAKTGASAVLENLVFNIKMDNSVGTSLTAGLVHKNGGIIKNLQLNLVESNYVENNEVHLLCYDNSGVIENFVVNFEKSLYIYRIGGLMRYNTMGTIKNGYIYGENIKVLNDSTDTIEVAGLVMENRYGGIVENVFTLTNVDKLSENTDKSTMGNLMKSASNNATVQNVYSVGIGANTTDFTKGPNVVNKNSKKIYNNYYFADKIFTSELETKGNKLSLWDAQFQNQIINEEGQFIVDELVNEGYYPHVNMPDCMPTQDFIELPEVEDKDLPDILSTKVLEQGTNIVKVEVSVNNPSAEIISDIEIANLDVEILSQEYNNGKSTVITELKNPTICVSKYNVLSISTKGAYGSTYKREYEEGERVINVDLYKEIWNVNDWKTINDSPTENYMLMEDLNFVNGENTIVINSVRGIIDGNEHSISNINLTNNNSLINNLTGTLKNFFIVNLKQESSGNNGLIRSCNNGSNIENIHMKNVSLYNKGSGYCGGIVGTSYNSNIINSSVNNIQIVTEETNGDMWCGGLARTFKLFYY